VIYSAVTRETSYSIPPAILQAYFKPDRQYHWHVRGLDDEGDAVVVSEDRVLVFK
jgi:hypothetical protein